MARTFTSLERLDVLAPLCELEPDDCVVVWLWDVPDCEVPDWVWEVPVWLWEVPVWLCASAPNAKAVEAAIAIARDFIFQLYLPDKSIQPDQIGFDATGESTGESRMNSH